MWMEVERVRGSASAPAARPGAVGFFFFELDGNRRFQLRCDKKTFRSPNDEIVVAHRDGWIVAPKFDSTFVLLDLHFVAKRDWNDKRLDFMKVITAAAQDFQRQIDLRGSENLHSLQFVRQNRKRTG